MQSFAFPWRLASRGRRRLDLVLEARLEGESRVLLGYIGVYALPVCPALR